MPQNPYVLVAALRNAGTEGELGRFETLERAMDAVDYDRELAWIQGGPDHISTYVGGGAMLTVKLADR